MQIYGRSAAILVRQFHLKDAISLGVNDQIWPLNYATYLLDSYDALTINKENEIVIKGIDVNVLGLTIRGSGALTGDFGYSSVRRPRTQVVDIIGPGYDLVFATLLSLTITFMYVAIVQRMGRQTVYVRYRPGVPPLADVKRLQAANYRQCFWLV